MKQMLNFTFALQLKCSLVRHGIDKYELRDVMKNISTATHSDTHLKCRSLTSVNNTFSI